MGKTNNIFSGYHATSLIKSLQVGLAGGFAALVSLLVVLVGAHVLSDQDSAHFQVAWSAMSACFGALSGISYEMTRSLSTDHVQKPAAVSQVWRMILLYSSAVLILGAAVVTTAGGTLIPASRDTSRLVSIAIAAAALGFVGQTTLGGALAGRRMWATYALVVATEAGVRLLMVVVIGVSTASLTHLAFAAALPTFVWLALLSVVPRYRLALTFSTDHSYWELAARCAATVFAQCASILLIVGFPLLLWMTSSANEMSAAAPLLLAITLTRAPLMLPLGIFQSAIVARFSDLRHTGFRNALRLLVALGALGALGSIIAWAIGPPLFSALSGGYRVGRETLALLTIASTLLTATTLTGIMCQARKKHGWLVGGWFVATIFSVLILGTPLGLSTRALLALLCGPSLGVAVHLFALSRERV